MTRSLALVSQAHPGLKPLLLEVERVLVSKDSELKRLRHSLAALHAAHRELKQQYASVQSEHALGIARAANEISDIKAYYETHLTKLDETLSAQSRKIDSFSSQSETDSRMLIGAREQIARLSAAHKELKERVHQSEEIKADSILALESEKVRSKSLESRNNQLGDLLEHSLKREKTQAEKLTEYVRISTFCIE